MKKLFFSTASLFVCIFSNYGQQSYNNNLLNMPQVVQSSPEAAGLGKYGDIPVGEYSGTPNISIPLYTVRVGKLSLPVTLSYHASGIGVSQEATLVGLGWNMIAGGCISYAPTGVNDQTAIYSTSWANRKKLTDYIATEDLAPIAKFGHEDQYYLSSPIDPPSESSYHVTIESLLAGLRGDGEKDVYSANFLNYSFKFIRDPENTNSFVFQGEKNKCIISYISDGFKITDENGVIYHFNAVESANGVSFTYISSWYLTQIISPDGDSIKLKYKSGYIGNIPSLSEKYAANTPNVSGSARNIASSNIISNLYLDTIETNKELIVFDLEGNRLDLSGAAKKLSGVRVIDKFYQTEKMRFNFGYDYFTGCNVGGDYLNDFVVGGSLSVSFGLTTDNLSKRLKLVSLTRQSPIDPLKTAEKYLFDYNESDPLPYKTSFARDHWGFYNGEENLSQVISNAKHTLIPNFRSVILNSSNASVPSEFLDIKGAFRGTNASHLTAGMLHSITYPTGGKTVFEFEPHSFNNYKYLNSNDEKIINIKESYSVYDFNSSSSKLYQLFHLTQKTQVKVEATISGHGYNKVYKLNELLNSYITIMNVVPEIYSKTYKLDPVVDSNFDNTGSVKTWSEFITLDTGKYVLICDLPDVLGDQHYVNLVAATVSYDGDMGAFLAAIHESVGAGVRIKTITNYDENNHIANQKKYTYQNPDGSTSGKLLSPLRCFKTQGIEYVETGNARTRITYLLSADSYIPSASSYVGNNVGYNRITVEEVGNGVAKGKEIDYYTNKQADIYFDQLPFFNYCSNGNLEKKIILNASSDTVRSEKYVYDQIDSNSKMLNFLVEDNHYGSTEVTHSFLPDSYRYRIMVYPNQNFKTLLQNKEIVDYLNGSRIRNTTDYSYNLTNYNTSEIAETGSDNRIIYTTFKYPNDFGSKPACDSLIRLNMINSVIEQNKYINDINSQNKTTINYALKGNLLVPYYIENQTGNNHPEIHITYDKYDDKGNILQLHKANDMNISYIWGYNQSLPIVKAEKTDYATLSSLIVSSLANTGYTSLDGLLKSITSLPNTNWTRFNQNLRQSVVLTHAMITTYTYDPLVGMTSSTDPNGITTYYDYDAFGRLKMIKDNNGKILKQFQYHYQNQ